MGSEQGSRRSGERRNLTLFVSLFPRVSLLGIVPKLDVAGSTPAGPLPLLIESVACDER